MKQKDPEFHTDKDKQVEIRVRSAEKEIYENITQVLCLVRIHLERIKTADQPESMIIINEASLLIGNVVRDLRNLAKRLTKPAHT